MFLAFDSLNVRLRPRFKIKKSNKKRLHECMQRPDAWMLEEGMMLDHVHLQADHIAFKTKEGIFFGLYDDGIFTIRCDDTRVDSKKVLKIDRMISEVLKRLAKFTGLNGRFEVRMYLHVIVKDQNLKRFIRAASASAQSAFLRRKLGHDVQVQGLILELPRGLNMVVSLPDDMDYWTSVHKYHKGVLGTVFSDTVSVQNRLLKG